MCLPSLRHVLVFKKKEHTSRNPERVTKDLTTKIIIINVLQMGSAYFGAAVINMFQLVMKENVLPCLKSVKLLITKQLEGQM